MPLTWPGPLNFAARSMSMMRPSPGPTCAVIRAGIPKEKPAALKTVSPLTCPALAPSVSMNRMRRCTNSCSSVLSLPERSSFAATARAMSPAETSVRPASAA